MTLLKYLRLVQFAMRVFLKMKLATYFFLTIQITLKPQKFLIPKSRKAEKKTQYACCVYAYQSII